MDSRYTYKYTSKNYNYPFLDKTWNHFQADTLYEFLTGKPGRLMTDEERKEMDCRCSCMAYGEYRQERENLERLEIISDHAIKWLIAGLFIGYLVIGNIAWWMVGAGADTQTYSKQQIIERIGTWK